MTSNLTIKQNKFCQKYIETGNASEAYRQAYHAQNMKPETIYKRANELLANGEVKGMISELQASHQKRHNVNINSITKELEEARQIALKAGNASAAISASLGKARVHGLLIDRGVVEMAVTAKIKDATSSHELARKVAFMLAKAASDTKLV